jgi:two-component sensor histidine kinase
VDELAPDLNDVPARWTPVFHTELSGLAGPQQARWMIREQLSGRVSVAFLRDIMLATSELVTNAIRYAPGPCRVTMSRLQESARIRIGVSDTGSQFSKPIAPTEPLMNGRGLLIVDTVASAWGTRPLRASDGKWLKEVWFEMAPDERS